ncbi:type VI secretion system Vgr family protein [Acerihabitans arboris]|uniref:Type VI secretion system tip protein VgrG n=1 Tax=Acerihabitans arboris TaxID=2691583 RepID=A0A845SMJ1_9GAMM|nr:type VI secretion system Vgr family protein [Acerihabitans arboris]NDL64186.1 type VI secretion system tip protein VgrG [Acerihabitans arboris]
MSITDTLNSLATAGPTLNRYHLAIEECAAPLDVEDFAGHEALSEPYRYTIRFTSPDPDIQARRVLRKTTVLTLRTLPETVLGALRAPVTVKTVTGVATAFQRLACSRDQTLYELTLQPFLALLDRQFRTHRFFVNLSVPEVVARILDEHGLKGWQYEFLLQADYPQREQINQYRESDLRFIQRLLAEVGIFYFFTLQPDTRGEVVHFADRQGAWPFGKTLSLNSPSGMNDGGAEAIWALGIRHNVAAASVTAGDYNHREAQNRLDSAPADMTRGDGEGITYGEVYHHQARHRATGDKFAPETESANFFARLDHERFLSQQTLVTGTSADATLRPGQVLTITDNSLPSTLPELLRSPLVTLGLTLTASRREALRVGLTAAPYSETRCWRPPLQPRPTVAGTLTARITSAREHDIYAWQDAAGLYRVKFDADRDDKTPGQESMPLRLAKPYGGDACGLHFPLIQGTEVAVAFHEGDPDRPYIAHALHDSRHPDPVTQDNSTRNVVRTPANNKLRMEDKRGEEHIKLGTEYGGKTQLNLGHNVDADRTLRGEGAELRTDRHIAIRGGAGVFITADKQPGAGGGMLAMSEALSQLEKARALTEALCNAAETAKAELADLQTQKNMLADTLKELKNPALLLSAPAGIAGSTPQHIQLAAGGSLMVNSGGNSDFSVLKKFTVAAGDVISLFAQKLGIKLFAARGKVEIQAQGDEMALDALKDLRISSSEGKVVISAKQEILLVSGGGYIRIGNGEVESGAPDKIIQRGAVWQKFGGQSASEMAQKWEKAAFSVTPKAVHPYDGSALANQKMFLQSDDAGERQLSADRDGKGTLQKQAGVEISQLKFSDKD